MLQLYNFLSISHALTAVEWNHPDWFYAGQMILQKGNPLPNDGMWSSSTNKGCHEGWLCLGECVYRYLHVHGQKMDD